MKWVNIFDLQDSTHGYVDWSTDQDFIGCPRCGEWANEPEEDWMAESQGGERDMEIPRYLRADLERAFIQAYYWFVCGCKSVSLDVELGGHPWVAIASSPRTLWMMDFSTHYEFPSEMKPATAARKMLERAVDAARMGEVLNDQAELTRREVTYEVWCFIPPSQKVLGAVEHTRANGGQVTLVLPDEVDARLRAAVLAAPDDPELNQAFVQAARTFRRAFGLRR